ncbi:MAG: RNA polymerase sigma factor [Phycisphaerales bacterium]|nr:RNA polymerase sigma factor [Phycisphaerales bacterium]
MSSAMSEKSLREWMARLGPSLLNLSFGICHDRHRAEEVVQEAFVRLWRQPPEVGQVAYGSWLRRVVTNLSINVLNRTRRPRALPDLEDDRALQDRSTPEAPSNTTEEMRRLHAALDRLDEPKRAILLLRGQEEMSYEAIATHLGVPVGTVMSRLNRARAALLEALEQVEGLEDERSTFDIRRYRKA